ncbi:hypothetical protein K2173_027948 [Erythroxylum novogranatense]|uniref:FYVE-type domain-containing protein n=1 Tax=Erythroxylum novogranatense TaxID=1862640 RepID=A0AAV8U1T1_9ROSI|nr:hypothetical protein K2173_027948 [Erythroxylum novogranatense]
MYNGDYAYYQHPHLQNRNPNNPNSIDPHQSSYASAPPYAASYGGYDSSAYTPNCPPFSQTLDSVPSPPSAPSCTPPTITPNNQQPIPQSQPGFPLYDPPVPYQQSFYAPYDQHHTASNYGPPPPTSSSILSNPSPSANPTYSSVYDAPYNITGSTVPPVYDNPYETGGYLEEKFGSFGQTRVDKRPESRFDLGLDDGYGDGVYAYDGGKVEPYGARGTSPKSSTWSGFDDYGRAISLPSTMDSSVNSGSGSPKVVRAVPKAETQQDVKSAVQKFRVKLLAESAGQTTIDVLCQIGLDGIRMLDPSTGRTLRIYTLENITRCEIVDASILGFWSKSSVDIEPRRIRLQSNSYTTTTLLDTVTAATVQLKEMGGTSRTSDLSKTTEQPTEKKKGFDWMNLMKPSNEEKDHWVPDEAVSKCTACGTDFGAFFRKHHCRNCGDIFCDKCTQGRIALTADENAQPVRVCDCCMAEVTQRLSNAKEAANIPAGLHVHEDLARKLQEELEKNRKALSGSKSDGSGRRTKEVACPTCTVHLQVQVPSSGSETIECGVCQHPFLVSAH